MPGDFKVRVQSRGDRSVSAESRNFLIDDEHRARCVRNAILLLGLPLHMKLPYPILRTIAMLAANS
eukprot:7023284-Prymnesium_polylepis.1